MTTIQKAIKQAFDYATKQEELGERIMLMEAFKGYITEEGEFIDEVENYIMVKTYYEYQNPPKGEVLVGWFGDGECAVSCTDFTFLSKKERNPKIRRR